MPHRSAGISLVELVMSSSVMVIAVLGIAGVCVTTSKGMGQTRSHTLVLARAKGIVEEIRATPPEFVVAQFDGETYAVTGVTGYNSDGSVLTVEVEATNPRLLSVSVSGTWDSGGRDESLTMVTRIFNPEG